VARGKVGGENSLKRVEPLLRERLVTKPSLEELFAGVEGKENRDACVYRAVVYG